MRTLIGACVLALAIPGLSAGQPQAQGKQNAAEQELLRLENNWNVCVVKKDIAGLEKQLAEEYIETDYAGVVSTKAEILAGLKSGDFAATSMTSKDMKVRVYGNFAVVTGLNTSKATSKGKDVSGEYRWTDTWMWKDGRWVCVASHNSRVARK